MPEGDVIVSVVAYEDGTDSDGKETVFYKVKVDATADGQKNVYFLRKRYSEFAKLNVALKERFPREYIIIFSVSVVPSSRLFKHPSYLFFFIYPTTHTKSD